MLENSVFDFLHKAASRSPAPGGGSVAALSGAMGAAMAAMAANFTAGRKGYEHAAEEIDSLLKILEPAVKKLAFLAEEDISAYEKVSAAYKLPSAGGKPKKTREGLIRTALLRAVQIPLETSQQCLDLMKKLPRLAEIANKNLISDVGVAAYLLDGALRSAVLNVEVNLKAIKDEDLNKKTAPELEARMRESGDILKEVERKVKKETAGN